MKCEQELGSCVCKLDEHEDIVPHECGDPDCNGSWQEVDGVFNVIRFPGDPDGSFKETLTALGLFRVNPIPDRG